MYSLLNVGKCKFCQKVATNDYIPNIKVLKKSLVNDITQKYTLAYFVIDLRVE